MRTNLIIAVLLGTLSNVISRLGNLSVDTWYSSTSAMWKGDYLEFYYWLCWAGFILGGLLITNSLQHRYWKVTLVILILFNLLTIVTGLAFTFNLKTDEYVIYFTEIQTFWIGLLVLTGIFLRQLFESELTGTEKNLVIISGIITAFLIDILFAFLTRMMDIEIVQLLIVTILILALIFWLSKRTTETNEI